MQPNNTENNPAPQIEQAQPTAAEPAPEIKSEENKHNWAEFRKKREEERKAREAAEKNAADERARAEALKAALEAVTNKPANNYQQQQNYEYAQDIAETEEQRIDRRVETLLKQRENEYEKQRLAREQQEAPQRIVQTYPDFNQVVTTENCDYLDYHYPELTAPFRYMPEGYEKWNAMYKAVKKFVPNVDGKKEQAKAEKNLNKPGSGQGATQGAQPGARLDEQRKAANWERMQKLLKGLT